MSGSIEEREEAFWALPPEEQTPELYQAFVDIGALSWKLCQLQNELYRVKAQSDERAARAWDKGYGAGHHDGRWHDSLLHAQSSTPRVDKGRRNPYRFAGGAGCGCHGGVE